MTAQVRQILSIASTVCFIIAVIYLVKACDAVHTAAVRAQPQINQAIQQLSTAQQQLQKLNQQAKQAGQPAEGSSCKIAVAGLKGVIVDEGPTAPDPGLAVCVPQS